MIVSLEKRLRISARVRLLFEGALFAFLLVANKGNAFSFFLTQTLGQLRSVYREGWKMWTNKARVLFDWRPDTHIC